MNHEQEAIEAAEQILKDALSAHETNQIKEQQSAMPWLANTCSDLLPIEQLGTVNDKVHIFAIRQVADEVPTTMDGLPNPMNVETNSAVVARLEHMYSFEADEEAHECLNSMSSSIVLNEGSKLEHNKGMGLFMSIRNQWFVLYAARRLTVSKRCGTDFTTSTASILGMEDTPDKFFANWPDISQDTKELITNLLFFAEAAVIMERKMPAVYKTMAQRIMNSLEDKDDE
jgi:hypothetical protein